MNTRSEPQKKDQQAPKKPEVRASDPGHTPGSAEGDRAKIEESLGERPSRPSRA